MNYLDANFVAALYFNIAGQSPVAETFVRRTSLPSVVSRLAELECRRAFIRRTGQTRSENWQRLQQQLEEKRWLAMPVPWESAVARSEALMETFGAGLNCGTLDILHVALAQEAGCTWFLSFDTNSNARVLASSARLKVYPDLTPQERARILR